MRLGTAGTGVIEGGRGPLYGCTGLCGSRRGRDDDGQIDGLLDAGGCVLLLGTPANSRDGRVAGDSVDMGPWPEMAQIFEMNFYHFEVPFVCSKVSSRAISLRLA